MAWLPGRILFRSLRDSCSPALAAHQERVARMSESLARFAGCDEEMSREIGAAGTHHDIGKVLVPAPLLEHPGALSYRERQLVRRHTEWGCEILTMTGDPALELSALVALQHHERRDGSGYPRGLIGAEICQAARIVAICDVYDMHRQSLPYRAARTHEASISAMLAGDAEGGPEALDTELLELFMAHAEQFRSIFDLATS